MAREATVTGRITATGPNTITVTHDGHNTTVDTRPAHGTTFLDPAIGDIVHVTGDDRGGAGILAYHISDVER